ncbi:MAG: hypothetical protein ACOWYE_06735, partial [Desulfatiglandales bacterium]
RWSLQKGSMISTQLLERAEFIQRRKITPVHYFTSITANYLPKARVLAKSVKRHDPGAVFFLMLSDRMPEGVKIEDEPFDRVISIDDLGIPDRDAWIFKHTVVELCTAVKGAALVHIAETTHADKIVYFDPDIAVLHSLDALSRILEKTSIALTPHQVCPDTTYEAIVDNEICSLKHGIYNLGFLGVRATPEGMRFARWWRDRLLTLCYDDIPNGLFTDQRWADLVPAFFDDVTIIRDKTYNVATWNLTHREVRSDGDGVLTIEGSPIKFYHFSGFDSGDQKVMLRKYADKNSPLFDLRKWYIQEMRKEGQREFGDLPCVYSFYSNGEKITDTERKVYRSRQDLIAAFPDPALVTEDKHCYYWWFRAEFKDPEAALHSVENPSQGTYNQVMRFLYRHPTLKNVLKTIWISLSRVTAGIRRLKCVIGMR